MCMTVRDARPDDAEHILGFLRVVLEEPNINLPLAPDEFRYTVEEEQRILAEYAAAENRIFLVAEVGPEIVGQLMCTGGGRRAMHHVVTLGMSVRKEWRNKGVGGALLTRAIDWAKSTGFVTRIELLVFARNDAAIHLYQKFGFETEGRRRMAVYRDGEYLDDLFMALLLPASAQRAPG